MKTFATLKDVARIAGVNDATVSRAFTGKAPVAVETHRRIMDAAAKIGYRPISAARATRTGRTRFLGMVCSSLSMHSVLDPAFEVGLRKALRDSKLCLVQDMVEDPCPEHPEPPAPRIVRERTVDGLLINYAFGVPRAVHELLDRCRIPAIWINCKLDENCVRPDDLGAATQATGQLLEQGHSRIAYVDGDVMAENSQQDLHYSVLDRRAGYAQAMTEAGLTPRFLSIPPLAGVAQRPGAMLRVYTQWLQQADRPTAVLCGNDSGRVMLLAAAQTGLRVPRDLSILTIDNDPGAQRFIALDRVVVPFYNLGQAAVAELCALIEQPGQPRQPVVLPFDFQRAGSVARPDQSLS